MAAAPPDPLSCSASPRRPQDTVALPLASTEPPEAAFDADGILPVEVLPSSAKRAKVTLATEPINRDLALRVAALPVMSKATIRELTFAEVLQIYARKAGGNWI